MDKNVLLIGFHFPPSALSSGHLRLLGYVKHLPDFGWKPVVLSARPQAYYNTDPSSIRVIPDGCHVCRAFALDTRRHLGINGKYPSILAQPDRWVSWWPAAVWQGLRLIRRNRIRAIWSTYPIMTAHCIAYTLSRMSGLPWIADFRDPVITSVAQQNALTIATQMRWERRVLSQAERAVFTATGAMRSYAERYPLLADAGRLEVIPNGFDEADFAELPSGYLSQKNRPLHFVHGGILYPDGRNPIPFFEALSNLKASGALTGGDIRVTLRASGSESQYAVELERLKLKDIVTLAPSLPYHEALAEQATADGLLLFQGSLFDNQIPSKLYEYLRLGRPIFALAGEQGESAALLRSIGGAFITSLDVVPQIEAQLMAFIHALRTEGVPTAHAPDVQQYSRQRTTRRLAELLDIVSG